MKGSDPMWHAGRPITVIAADSPQHPSLNPKMEIIVSPHTLPFPTQTSASPP